MKDERPGFGNYYTAMQVSEILGKDLFEVNRMVRRGILPAASINKHRWIPVKAVEDLVRSEQGPGKLGRLPEPQEMQNLQMDKPQNQNTEDEEISENPGPISIKKAASREETDYYTVEEVARILNKPSREIWRMVFFGHLEVDLLEGERVFPKKAFEDFLTKRRKEGSDGTQSTSEPGAGAETIKEFHGATVEEAVAAASAALGVDSVEIAYEVIEHGSNGFLGTGKRDARIKLANTAPYSNAGTPSDEAMATDTTLRSGEDTNPSLSHTTANEPDESADVDKEIEGGSKVHTVASDREIMKAAQRIGTSINRVRQMVDAGKLVIDPDTGRLGEPVTSAGNEPSMRDRFDRAAKHREMVKEASERLGIPTSQVRKKIAAQELVTDTNTGRWVYPNQSLAQEEPDEEPESPTQITSEAQRIEELEEWVRDLRHELRIEREENERLTRALDLEREEHEQDVRDAQYEVDRLDAELENIRRGTNNSVLGSRLKQERELREAAERWGRDLESQLDSEAAVKVEREKWFAGLESRLDASEDKRKELEHELSLLRARVRKLQEEQRVLNEVRRVLDTDNNVGQVSTQKDVDDTISPSLHGSDTSHHDDILLETRHGEWRFRPPFPLKQDEIELIRLIVGEDEITAEQIRNRKNRRSVEKLNDLLDRLLESGIEPIKEDNDRYTFDPDYM